jgi:hypothetical protein
MIRQSPDISRDIEGAWCDPQVKSSNEAMPPRVTDASHDRRRQSENLRSTRR